MGVRIVFISSFVLGGADEGLLGVDIACSILVDVKFDI